MAKYLDQNGVNYLWQCIKANFIGKYAGYTSAKNGTVAVWDGSGLKLKSDGFTLGRSVPADARFADDITLKIGSDYTITPVNGVYTIPVAAKDTLGAVKTDSAVTTVSGDAEYHSVPIINGIPYYHDTVYVHPLVDKTDHPDTSSIKAPDGTDGTFTVVDSIVKDTAGHVQSVNTATVKNVVTTDADADTLPSNEVLLGNGGKKVKSSGKTIATTVTATESDHTTIPTGGAVRKAINDATADLSGAMHFVGITNDSMTDGQTTMPVIEGVQTQPTFKAGDVVLCKSSSSATSYDWEFVLGNESPNPKWHKLGDDASFALKSTQVIAGAALTGGGSLSSNVTINHDTLGDAGTYGGVNGSTVKIPTVVVDQYGHVTDGSETDFEALAKGDIDTAIAAAEASFNGTPTWPSA